MNINRIINVAFQIDIIESLDLKTDSTILFMYEAYIRGYNIFSYEPKNLSFCEGKVVARGVKISFVGLIPKPIRRQNLDLSNFDIIFIRQNPPFNMFYISATYILDLLKKVIFINNPSGIRNSPEKLLTTYFPELIPPTIISRDIQVIQTFIKKYISVVLKPLYNFGGRGVLKLKSNNNNLFNILKILLKKIQEPIVIQKFLPEVYKGDIRILLFNQEPVGAFRRVPKQNDFRGNLIMGGRVEKYLLTNKDREICEVIKPILKKHGLIFVGIDIINGFLIEINTTSPTGINAFNKIENITLESSLWDIIEKKFYFVG